MWLSRLLLVASLAASVGLAASAAPAAPGQPGIAPPADAGKSDAGAGAEAGKPDAAEAKVKPGPTARPSTIGLASAGLDPGSVRVVDSLASMLEGETLQILPVLGRGPVQTVSDLYRLPGVDIGIVPADVLPYLQRGRRLGAAGRSIRYIAKLYEEEVHVLARREIVSLADLQGKKVDLGPRDSATWVTGTTLFEALRMQVEPVAFDGPVALEKLRRGEVAAIVLVAKKPARPLFELNRSEGLHLVPIPLAEPLAQTYLPAKLAAEDYPLLIAPGDEARVQTIAVPMVLAVNPPVPKAPKAQAVARFIEALFQRGTALHEISRQPLWREFEPADGVAGWRRLPIAEAKLKEEIAASGSSTPAALKRGKPAATAGGVATQNRNALFRQFVAWRQKNYPDSVGSPKSQEDLFREFLRYRTKTR